MFIEGFGKKRVNLFSVEGTDKLLKLEFSHEDKMYYGVIDKTNKLLVTITSFPIVEIISTEDNTNYCFIRYDEEKNRFESIHLQKQEDDKFVLKADIKGNEVTNCRLIGTIKDDYWFIESTTDGITNFCLYDVRNAKILTPGFTEISFEEEKSRVLAYVEKDIVALDEGKVIYLTSLLSYIDYEGNFITPIYDTEIDMYYDARSYNFDKSFKSYNRFLESIATKSLSRYQKKNEHVTEVLADMFTNLYSVEEIKNNNTPAKILEYKRSNK